MNSGPFGHEADGDNNNTPKYSTFIKETYLIPSRMAS